MIIQLKNRESSKLLVYMPHAGSFGREGWDLAQAVNHSVWMTLLTPSNTRQDDTRRYLQADLLIERIVDELSIFQGGTVVFAGHSFGAFLAYHTAERFMRHRKSARDIKIIVSGSKPFDRVKAGELVLNSRDDLQAFLRSTGDSSFLPEEDEIIKEYLGYFNAHLHYCDVFSSSPTAKLDLEAHVISSPTDVMMTSDHVDGWDGYFVHPAIKHVLPPCGHLYLKGALSEYSSIVNSVLEGKPF